MPLFYEDELLTDVRQVTPYTRADFWNLLPWEGPKLVWGQSNGTGITFRQDHPPFYHQCTLARDFVAHWPLFGSDSSIVGRCDAMIPLVCAYCWGQTWRRCDSLPRVGAYEIDSARLSPILDECGHCGLASDHHIVRCIVTNNFEAILAMVSRGAATIHDVLRCVDGCANFDVLSLASRDGVSHIPGSDIFGGALGLTHRATMLTCAQTSLCAAFTQVDPRLADTTGGAGLLIMEYWQGTNLRSPTLPSFVPRRGRRACSHSFPCVHGGPDAGCLWMDDWANKWVVASTHANPRYNGWLADHCDSWSLRQSGADWAPDSWAVWEVLRAHECDDENADMGNEGDAGEGDGVDDSDHGDDNEAPGGDNEGADEKTRQDDTPRLAYWPVQGPLPTADNRHRTLYNLSWEAVPLRWDEYPFRPEAPNGCNGRLIYESCLPANVQNTPLAAYTRGDYWNLLPWEGRNLIWGQGYDGEADVRQDHPPFYHQCTLARDYITHWPLHGADPSVVGSCGAIVPVVCAYCWSHNWRRCDTLPRVGAYPYNEARLSPVLDVCAHCGLTSDHNIVRCIITNNFDAVFGIVARGAATIHDILRCVNGCARLGSPYAIAGLATGLGYELFGGAAGFARRKHLLDF